MKTFSKNTKLDNCLTGIYNQLLEISESEEVSRKNIAYHKSEYKKEVDFNLAQYGNLLVYYNDIRNFYISCGYKAEKWSDEKVWGIYKRQVGYIARNYFN